MKLRISISIIAGLAAFIIAAFLSGWLCLLIPGLWFLGWLGSFLGLIPFVGPVVYYFPMNWIFNAIIRQTHLDPISSGILFWTFFAFSILHCIISSGLLIAIMLGED